MSLLLTEIPDLPAELSRLLSQIPPGRVTTYGDLARALGDVAAARWVGEFLLDHPHTADCCCHRVVRKGGEIGLYISGNPQQKRERLQSEGLHLDGERVSKATPFTDFDSDAPLRRLYDWQQRLPQQVELSPLERPPRSIAGIDVSYVTPQLGVAAYVKLRLDTHEVLWSTTVCGPVTFPYIPGYLTFRELPLFVRLFEDVRRARQEAHVTLVDGNGTLHPRRSGSATAVGVAVETPTIGIGKKLLCGQVDLNDLAPRQPREVLHQQELIGVAMKSGERNRPFYASPGHRTNLDDATRVVLQTLGTGRLPQPIAAADRLSREEAIRLRTEGLLQVDRKSCS